MELSNDFVTFLQEIRPTSNQRSQLKDGHKTLRKRLEGDPGLSQYIVSTFLQGSYRRHTAIRPKGDKRSDVDIIVVTNLSERDHTPRQAMAKFEAFLDKHYAGKWTRQGRSFGIEMSHVDLDVVITSAPSEAVAEDLRGQTLIDDADIVDDEHWLLDASAHLSQASSDKAAWKTEPLRISNREANEWEDTHPLAQLAWTWDKNKQTNRHYVNVVKALKWWRLETDGEARRPKGFLLERIIGEYCPDDITSVAEGIVYTLENITVACAKHRREGTTPYLADYGLGHMNVLARLEQADFDAFYDSVAKTAPLARAALDSQDADDSRARWRALLGAKFPPPQREGQGEALAFDVAHRERSRWVAQRLGRVTITGTCRPKGKLGWQPFSRWGPPLPAEWDLRFKADTDDEFAWVYWQVVNTGTTAQRKDGLRGQIRRAGPAGRGGLEAIEATLYPGRHWIECFLVNRAQELVARSGPFVVAIE